MGSKEKLLPIRYCLFMILVACGMLFTVPVFAQVEVPTVVKKDLIYTYDAEDDSYTVTGHVKRPDWETHTYTVLPSINGNPVRAVAAGALACRYVSLPDSVVKLHRESFSSYINGNWIRMVKGVKFGRGIKKLNYSLYASELKEVVIPGSVTELEKGEFQYCPKLKEIRLEPEVRSIQSGVFAGDYALKKIYIPSTVTYIDKNFLSRDGIRDDGVIEYSLAFSARQESQPDVVICCSPGSYALQYAKDHNRKYSLTYDVENILTATTVKAGVTSANKIKVSWKLVGWADGYRIYRSTTGKEGSFTIIKKITNGEMLSYTDQTVKAGRKYYYRVRAYRMDDGKAQMSCYKSNTASVRTRR